MPHENIHMAKFQNDWSSVLAYCFLQIATKVMPFLSQFNSQSSPGPLPAWFTENHYHRGTKGENVH